MPSRGVSKVLLALKKIGRCVSKIVFALITSPPRCQLEETIVAQLAKGCPAAGIIAESGSPTDLKVSWVSNTSKSGK